MRTETQAIGLAERPTPEELDALRRRLSGSGAPDLRADSAATLDDVAEALDLPPEAVREELDRLRAERAIRPLGAAKKDQRPLLVFALVLLAAAYPIHLLNPRKLSADEDLAQAEDRLNDIRARRKAHPVVHYPILTRVRTGPLPPYGFDVEFRGELTTTDAEGKGGGDLLNRDEAATALTEGFLNAYAAAREAERAAPRPTKPLPHKEESWNSMAKPAPGVLAYAIGKGGYMPRATLSIDPEPGFSPATWDAEVRRRASALAKDLLDSLARGQAESLKLEPPRWGNQVMPPYGYDITVEGRQGMKVAGSTGHVILPYDASSVARKLEWSLRHLLWHDGDPPDFSTPESLAAFAKKPVPAFDKVTIDGPGGKVEFEVPMTASAKYPTAADAARAADRIVEEAVRKAAAQVGPLTAGGPTP